MSRDRWTAIRSSLHFSRNATSHNESDDDNVIGVDDDDGETLSGIPLLHRLNDSFIKAVPILQ